MKYAYLLVFSLFVLLSCDESNPLLIIDVGSSSGIDLKDLKKGDQASYVRYHSGCSNNFEWSGDTLVVSVIEKNDSLFLHEEYTAGSSRQGTVEHSVFPKDGYVLIPQRFNSEFLFFYGNDSIFLDRPTTTQLIQSGCQLLENSSPFVGESIGSVDEFQFGKMRVSNKKGISCEPGQFDLDAYIFYTDHLNAVHIVRHGVGDVIGFIAIE